MPFVRRDARVMSGSVPEAERGGRSKKIGGAPKGSRRGRKAGGQADDKSSPTAAKKAEINTALPAKWEREAIGTRPEAVTPKPRGSQGPKRRGGQPRPAAESPGVVVRTFKPAGQLQLHRLRTRTQIHCVRCQQSKTAVLVATMKGDWAQILCEHCYGVLAHEQRERAEKRPAAGGRAAVPPQRPQARIRPGQLKRSLPQPIPLKGRRRRSPAENSLLAFFRAAGIQAELVGGGILWVNGSQIELRWMVPSHTPLDVNSIIDEVALKYTRDKFARAVEENSRFEEGLRVEFQRHERGFVVMRGDVRLAVIHANRAQIPGRDVMHANFLVPGPQWQQAADILHDAEPELVAEWVLKRQAEVAAEAAAAAASAERRHAAARHYMDRMPDHVAPDLISACIDASRRIRLERQLAYARPVVLEFSIGRLTLLPIAGSITGLLMPFRLNTGIQTLNGELVLSDRDPLPLLIGEDVAEQDAITAWTCALLGFADATCIELKPTRPPPRSEPKRPRRHPPLPGPPPPSTQTLPRSQRWPRHLEPVGHWIRYSGSFVAGHRRHLNDDQVASPQAQDWARQVGIILRPHETWVRPHTRGVPEGIEMRFRWQAPAELNLRST